MLAGVLPLPQAHHRAPDTDAWPASLVWISEVSRLGLSSNGFDTVPHILVQIAVRDP